MTHGGSSQPINQAGQVEAKWLVVVGIHQDAQPAAKINGHKMF